MPFQQIGRAVVSDPNLAFSIFPDQNLKRKVDSATSESLSIHLKEPIIHPSRPGRLHVLIDHSGEAEKAGMKMRPTKLLIFGNPKPGTPLMLAAPLTGIIAAWLMRRRNPQKYSTYLSRTMALDLG